MKTLHVAIQMILAMALPLAAQLWDRKRMTPEQRTRVWNYATWGSAIYAWNILLSMVAWVFVTRRGPRLFSGRTAFALALGIGAQIVLIVVFYGLSYLLALTLGLDPDKL